MTITKILGFILITVSLLANQSHATSYMTQKEFLLESFHASHSSPQPEAKTLWLDEQLQQQIEQILDHRYPKLRLRYWQQPQADSGQLQTVWFLDEIGKERPISFAISIKENRVSLIKVLAFRESRGGEIRMQAFSDQFNNIGLNAEAKLDRKIDGISGATMSVTAMKKITRLAIMLHKKVTEK